MKRGLAAVLGAVLMTGCGYHIAGRADLLPKRIQTIAIPAFGNLTTRYKLSERLPAAIGREFITRTRYRVVADPNEADAVLTGAVVSQNAYPTVTDPITGRATGVQLIVMLSVTLTDKETGQVLYSRPQLEARARYEISVDQEAYFEESGVALDRMAADVARSVVSAILEAF